MSSSLNTSIQYALPSTPSSRNPITLRLRKILGTTFHRSVNDRSTANALAFIQHTIPLRSLPSLTFKNQTPTTTTDDSWSDLDPEGNAPRNGVSGHADVASETARRVRKNLQRDLENKLAEGSRHFLKAFGDNDLQKIVTEMRQHCDDAEAQLKLTEEASRPLLEQAESLRYERQEVETRKSIVLLFLDRFTLSDDEVEAITSREIALGSRFFSAMNKTEQIRGDCRVLMSGEDGPTKAGDVLTVLSEARQSTLLTLFLDALTRGGPSGLPRPIELHAHDPIRYVGDMLAWVHQALAVECEFLESLFGLNGQVRMVGAVRTFNGSEEEEWMMELLNSSVGKLCVPLKVRVLQTVRAQESSILSYKVSNLLQYYMLTMQRTIGDQSVLSQTLQEITEVSYRIFFDSIEAQGRALHRMPLDLDDSSLSPPHSIIDHAQLLREIMQVYDSSLLSEGSSDPSEASTGFRRILDVMVDPAITMCAAAAEEKTRLRPEWDRAVFVLNNLCYLENVLEPFSFTEDKRKEVRDNIEEKVQLLEDEHYENILKDASLSDAIRTLETRDPATPLSRLPATEPEALAKALGKFSLWLSTPDVISSPRLSPLFSSLLTGHVHRGALRRLVCAYSALCEEVRAESARGKYVAGSVVLGRERPFGQVELLRQVFGLEEDDS
ncbi:oligomeric complex COG6 [Lanmaoa asiatica]|nr:oligomeric complex COG6 [Lanmaoa asiatica]